MTVLQFISQIADAFAWPVTVIFIVLFFRKPIYNLLPFLERLRYKDFEVYFRRTAEEALQSIPPGDGELINATVSETPIIGDTRSAIMKAWESIRVVADDKLKELLSPQHVPQLGPGGALGYIEYLGAFTPQTKEAISKLGTLCSQVAHYPCSTVSLEGAKMFVLAAKTIEKQIQSLTSLPQIKLTKLTYLILEYNHLGFVRKHSRVTL